MTSAGVPSVKLTVIVSALPSGFGVTTLGVVARFVNDKFGTGTGRPIPIVPLAALAPGEAIVQVKTPLPATRELHVQSTAVPVPLPLATVRPSWSTTVTVHGSDEERRAWMRTGPPSTPETVGLYNFGRPVSDTRFAIPGRRTYVPAPGHSLGPVSR